MALCVAFALLSLVFAGLLDVVYCGYARLDRSHGMYVLGLMLALELGEAIMVLARA